MRNKKNLKTLLSITGILILLLIVASISVIGMEKKDRIRVGFVMTGSRDEQGWNRLHYEGILDVCEELDAELIVKENVKENTGECEQAIRDLAGEDTDVIILSSYGYAKEVLDVVEEYPEIAFYSEAFDYTTTNMKSYFARMYQARYLTGIVAGMYTESNSIGYIAAMPNNEVNRGINAFTLGVQSVNPDARVIVAWSNSWDDPGKEKELATKLITQENIDVVTYHQNQPNVVEVAEEYEIASIGYHEAEKSFSDNLLTAAVFNWGPVYEEIILDFIRGKSEVVDTYWVGIERGAIGLSEYSAKVSQDIKEEVEQAIERMKNGVHVFSGDIWDTDGKRRCADGENISDDVLLTDFNWYVKGVDFYEE